MRRLITRLLEPKDNAPEAAYLLAELLGAKISRSTLEKAIKTHPDYPAFLSISDILTGYGVDNITALFNKEKIIELPTPFLTQVIGKKEVAQYTVVKEISNSQVVFYDPELQAWRNIAVADFTQQATTRVLIAELENPVTEKDYPKKIKEEKRVKLSQNLMAGCIPLLLLASVSLAFFNFGTIAIFPVLYSVLNLAGTIITTLLLWYEVDQTNTVLQDICTGGKKVNCSAILQSKDAKIFGISWSVIGFVYFAGSLVMLLLLGITNSLTLSFLSWLTLGATPYVFYSIYYQWKEAKQWCVLCLSVQAILLTQCVVTFAGGWHILPTVQNYSIFASALTAFALPFIAVSMLMPSLRKAKESNALTMELQRLKHSPEIFKAVLERQRSVVHSPRGLGIVLGSLNPKIEIIKVCNPYCGPCAKAHAPMEALLHNNPDLQVQIIFTASNEDHDKRAIPVRHLLAVDQRHEGVLTEKALGDWYLADKKNYEHFARKYPMNGELKMQDEKIEAMRDWCTRTEIKFTPTFFVNGYQLPSNYSVDDLKYFLSV